VKLWWSKWAGRIAIGAFAAGVTFSGGLTERAVAHAQNIGQRVVFGSVLDDDTNFVGGATVFLKYLKTKSIRSYTTQANGKFRFTQVNMAEDYELWAEKDGVKSVVKTVSQWDARKEFEVDLKLKKTIATPPAS
jgi:Carboxypeptidase regulatory-like domain